MTDKRKRPGGQAGALENRIAGRDTPKDSTS